MRAELVGLLAELRTLAHPQEHFAERLDRILAAYPEDEINDLRLQNDARQKAIETIQADYENAEKRYRETLDRQTQEINNLKHALAAAESQGKANADPVD